jgi:hypothetical protein
MEHRHVNNLSALIHFMENLSAPDFSMERFVNKQWGDECGTPSCALGWATAVPALESEGLDIRKLSGRDLEYPWRTAEKVFGTYWELFNSGLCETIKTPQQWATHARAFLKSKGHEVTPQTTEQRDDFKAFMDRVLRPVATASAPL